MSLIEPTPDLIAPDVAEVEMCWLSACLIDEGVLDMLRCANLPPSVLGSEFAQTALAAMLAIVGRGDRLDLVGLAREMGASGAKADYVTLARMASMVETTARARTHFRILVDAWRMRSFRALLPKFHDAARRERWEDAKDDAMAIAATISDGGLMEEGRSQIEIAESALAETDRLIEGRDAIGSRPIETGIGCVDRFCRPLDLATGDFNCILFAATSTGKSSLMAGIVGHNVARGMRVAVFLGETNHEGLLKQIAGQRSRVSIDPVDFRQEPRDRQARFRAELVGLRDAVKDGLLWGYDDRFYIEDVVGRCRQLKRDRGDIDLIVIDHLHCLKSRRQFKDERLRFNYMSGELKPLAKEIGCPVLTLAQPSRAFKDGARPPLLSDLKESGNLEDDADRVWALYLPAKDSDGNEQDRYSDCPQIELHQLKFRRGRTTSVRLRLERRYTRFYDDMPR